MKTLSDLFDDTIKDLYNAEKQFLKALPKLANAAQNQKLKSTIEDHISQTEGHVKRLEEVASIREIKPSGKVCKAAQGLVDETAEHLEEFEPGPTLDAAIVLCAQKNEHYEITSYGTLMAWARVLGLDEVFELLEVTFNEERTADHLLTDAARLVNQEATGTSDGPKVKSGATG